MKRAEELRYAIQHAGDASVGELTCLKELSHFVNQKWPSVEYHFRTECVDDECDDRQRRTGENGSACPETDQRRKRVTSPKSRESSCSDQVKDAGAKHDGRAGDPALKVAGVARPFPTATNPIGNR